MDDSRLQCGFRCECINTAMSMKIASVKCVNPKLDLTEATIGIKQRIDSESLPTSIEMRNLMWLRKIMIEEKLFESMFEGHIVLEKKA